MPADPMELLHEKVRSALKKLGYDKLLPVQEKAIPVIFRGYHTLIVAPTGSGKTEAAILPVLSMMASEKSLGGGVKAIYITPLRALNRDITWRIERLIELVGFKVQVRHGDTGSSGRRRFLEEPPDFAVMTPESLSLLLASTGVEGRGRRIWGNVRWVIVDEIQEFLESERGAELSVVLERLEARSRSRIQRIGLSATLSGKSAHEAAKLLAYGRRVEIVTIDEYKDYDLRVHVVNGTGDTFESMASEVADIIEREGSSTLVFVNTRSTAEALGRELARRLGRGLVGVHHGSLDRSVREDAEVKFKKGDLRALVATSSMELGIDVGRVDLVVQFMSPRQAQTMTQRAGRAGHRLGLTSRATIVVPRNLFEVLEAGVIALRVKRGKLEDIKPHMKPLDALAHQLTALVIEGLARTLEEAYRILSKAYPFSMLSISELEEVARHLDSVKVLRYDESSGELREGRRARSYFYKVSMIPDELEYTVVDVVSDSKIGEVSEKFIEYHALKQGGESKLRFILAGRLWEALEVDQDSARVVVKPISDYLEHLIPSWHGELIPVDYKVAREVCSIISLAMDDPELAYKLLESRFIPGDYAKEIIDDLLRTVRDWGDSYLTPTTPVIEEYRGVAIVYACLGSRGNLALALVVSNILERLGVYTQFESIPYAIVFKSRLASGLGELIREALIEAKSLDHTGRLGLIINALRKSTAYMSRFREVAKRMGVFDPDARIPLELLKRAIKSYGDSIVARETVREMLHEKLDLKALNEFLDLMKDPIVVKPQDYTPLAKAVLTNPYIRSSEVAVDIKAIAIDKLIQAKKARLHSRNALMLCVSCGYYWSIRVSEVPKTPITCPRCQKSLLAPLPESEWGRSAVELFKRRHTKLSKEEKKVIKELKERALLYLTYAAQGLGSYVVEALMAKGVGPQRAKRILSKLVTEGEGKFYEEIIKAEEEYIANRKYWST